MARRLFNTLFGSALADALVAGFAAMAVAFVAWAMPNDLFSDLVGASGLPALLPVARPPLGDTARMLTMLALAGAVFIFLFTLLRLIGYRPARAPIATASRTPVAPKVRRADAHPDAPSRAPISAMSELGTPIPPPWPEPAPAAEVDELDDLYRSAPVFGDDAADELALAEPFAPAEPTPPAEAPQQPPPPPISGNESIGQLMQRLEQSLSKLGGFENEVEPAAAPPADDRLRNAIEDLQRLAARN